MNTENSVPESLMVAVEKRYKADIQQWWESLTDEQRMEFMAIACLSPEKIAKPRELEAVNSDDDEVNEWYEYVVNQDVRFYFDRSQAPNPKDTGHSIVFPIIAPVSNAAEIEVVSHLLTNPWCRRS